MSQVEKIDEIETNIKQVENIQGQEETNSRSIDSPLQSKKNINQDSINEVSFQQNIQSEPEIRHLQEFEQVSSQNLQNLQSSCCRKKWRILGLICGLIMGLVIFKLLILNQVQYKVTKQNKKFNQNINIENKTSFQKSKLSQDSKSNLISQKKVEQKESQVILQTIDDKKIKQIQKINQNHQIVKNANKKQKQNQKLQLNNEQSNLKQTLNLKIKQQQKKINIEKEIQKQVYFGVYYKSKDQVPDQRKITAVFTTCCNRSDLLQITLRTFFQFSTYPYEVIIVVHDGQANQQFNDVLQKFKQKNISFLQTKTKVGQINAVDQAYSLIKTPYIFHSEDDWQFLNSGFIQESLILLQKQPLLLQVWIQKHKLRLQPKTRKSLSWYTLSFNPGLRRLSDYKQIESYSKLTNNKSNGLGAGNAEDQISGYYKKKGRYVVQTQTQYTRHIGSNRSNTKYWYKKN